MDYAAAILTAIAAVIASVAAFISAMVNRSAIHRVHDEVKTANGITLAALADRTEGRRISENIPQDERTSSEQHYVENLDEPRHT